MKVTALENSCQYGQPGIFKGHIEFDNPTLKEYRWPLCEIRGHEPGAKLCVFAGIHVNEVCSIEAAIRIQKLFDPEKMHGTISVIPVVNLPGRFRFTEYVCPEDGKNITYTFPGKEDGTFSEALSYAIMNEWSVGADCCLDLHGGDLRENVAKFVFYQKSPDQELEEKGRKIAMCFDANVIYGMDPEYMTRPYLTPAGYGSKGRIALTVESGRSAILEESPISYHVNGILNVARLLGIIDTPMTEFENERLACAGEYFRLACPLDGEFHSLAEPGDHVTKGQTLGTMRNLFGETIAEIKAPETGVILWRITHPQNTKGTWLYGLVIPEELQADMPHKKITSFGVHGLWS